MYASDFEDLFAEHGRAVRWWRSMGKCPCNEGHTWDRGHALCGGTGFLRVEEETSGARAIITTYRGGRGYGEQGQIPMGELVCHTWPGELPLAEGDWIASLSREAVTHERLVRGSGTSDALREPAPVEIDRVYTKMGRVLSGFTLVGATVEWVIGALAEGTPYAVRYRYRPVFQVKGEAVTARAADPEGSRLPQTVRLSAWAPGPTETIAL